MKKIIIVLVILFVLMGVFSMDILGRNITDIQRRMVDQTNYRINVVKGKVAVANINKTFDCYIAGETVIYPTIPTFSRDPKLQVGDEVTIEFINGCRETPVILAPEDIREIEDTTLPGLVPGDIYIYRIDDSGDKIISAFNSDGSYLCTWGEPTEIASEYVRFMAVDASGNLYIGAGPNATWFDWIFKYDAIGNLLLSLDLSGDANKPRGMVIGPDGKLYTNTRSSPTQYLMQQRNLIDLTVDNEINLTGGDNYGGKFVFDSGGNFYTHNFTHQRFERWTFGGGRQAIYAIWPIPTYLSWGSWETFATANNVLSCFYEYWTGDDMIFTIPTAFGEAYTRHDPTDITTGAGIDSALVDMASIGNDFLLMGKDAIGNLIIQKCNTGIIKIWTTTYGIMNEAAGHRDAIIAAYPF